MTTESELLNANFVLPKDNDFVSQGDDAIRANAKAAYEHAQQVARLESANAIKLTRIQANAQTGIGTDGYGTEVGLIVGGSPAQWFGQYLTRLIHISDTAPESPTVDGFPVLWVDTRDRAAWRPLPAIINDDTKRIIIPDDEGAVYLLNGNETSPGEYHRPTNGEPVEYVVTARAKEGYVLAGAMTWRGFITAGWELAASDSLTRGSWTAGRMAGSLPWQNLISSDGSGVTSTGLVNGVHNASTSGDFRPTSRRIAQRLTVTYDLSSIGGSNPVVSLLLGIKSDLYGEHSQLYAVNLNGRGQLSFSAIGRDAVTAIEGELNGHPSSGSFTVEAMGSQVKAFINGVKVAEATVPGIVTAHAAGIRLTSNKALAKNFTYEVK